MSEAKVNLTAGVAGVALVVAGSSFVYTNMQVAPLLERLDSLEEDLTSLAINLKNLRSVYDDQNRASQKKVRALSKKVGKLGKNSHESASPEDIENIKADLLQLYRHLKLNEETMSSLPREKPKRKNVRIEEEEEGEDSTDLDEYLASKIKKK